MKSIFGVLIVTLIASSASADQGGGSGPGNSDQPAGSAKVFSARSNESSSDDSILSDQTSWVYMLTRSRLNNEAIGNAKDQCHSANFDVCEVTGLRISKELSQNGENRLFIRADIKGAHSSGAYFFSARSDESASMITVLTDPDAVPMNTKIRLEEEAVGHAKDECRQAGFDTCEVTDLRISKEIRDSSDSNGRFFMRATVRGARNERLSPAELFNRIDKVL